MTRENLEVCIQVELFNSNTDLQINFSNKQSIDD